MDKLHTDFPELVYLISGSLVKFPMIFTLFKLMSRSFPLILVLFNFNDELHYWGTLCAVAFLAFSSSTAFCTRIVRSGELGCVLK